MEFEDFGARFSVAVEDFSESWPLLQETLQGRGPLRHVTLRTKVGNPVPITELPVQFLLSTDSKLQNIKPFQSSPVTWFRNPYARLILVSGEDADDYKKSLRGQLKALIEREKDPLGPTEWVVCYIKPAASDPLSKGPRKVFDALRHDFNTRRRERCVRLDFPVQQGQGSIAGLEELEQLLKAAVKASFETRAAAYEEEVRKLMARRLEPGWNFSTFYLIKDSLAIMMEAAGLLEDAFREYFELEACYLEALKQGGNMAGRQFGGKTDGDDVAQILKAAWRETRGSVMRGNGVAEFYFRQYLFACQARLLFKLNRPTEVAERGLQFVHTFAQLLGEQQGAASLPGLFREAWAFSACISLATTTSRLMAAPAVATKKPDQPSSAVSQPYRRSISVNEDEGAERSRGLNRSQSAGDLTQNQSGRSDADSSIPHRSTADQAQLDAPALKPLKINKNNFAGLEARGLIAQLTLPKDRQQGALGGEGPAPAMHMEVDWDLGVSGHSDDLPDEEEEVVPWSRTPSSHRRPAIPHQAYWCLLGHLYAAARLELMRMGHALHLSHLTPPGPAHGNGASPRAARLSSHSATPVHSPMPPSPFTVSSSAPASVTPAKPLEQQSSQQPAQQNGLQLMQEPAPSTDLGTASSLNAAVSAASSRRPQLHTSSSKKLSRFAEESQRQQGPGGGVEGGLPPLAPPTPVTVRGDSVTSQVSTGPGSSPAKTTTDEGDETSSNDGSLHRSEIDYSTLARAEAAAQQQETSDAAAGRLQRTGALPSTSSDAGHLGLQVGEQQAPADASALLSAQQVPAAQTASNAWPSGNALDAASNAVPSWLSDWRLKLALGSWQLYQELWMELSGAAAACYSKCGRKRNGALMQSDIVDALLARGDTARAGVVLQRQCRLFLREGWWHLAATALPRLLHCQKLLMQAVLPATCLQLLGLPQQARQALQLEQHLTDLLQVAQQPPRTHPSAALFGPRDLFNTCNTGTALFVRPLDSCYSMFSGQTNTEGQPVLNSHQFVPFSNSSQTPDRPLNQTLPGTRAPHHAEIHYKGALDICVGDAVNLTVEVHSSMPSAVRLEEIVLTLALLQEVTIAYSPKSSTSSQNDFGRTMSSVKRATDSPMATSSARSRSGDLAALAEDADVTTQWQETEELVCSLTQAPSTCSQWFSDSNDHNGNSHRNSASDLHLLSSKHLPTGSAILQPGQNQLSFQALPLKRGLYTLKRMEAKLGCLSLHIPVSLSHPGEASVQLQPPAQQPAGHGSETTGPKAATLGSVLSNGQIQQETVVMNVHSCRQRVAVSAAALRGTLVAGQPQWLAVALMPLHDALQEASIHVGMANHRHSGVDAALGSSALSSSLGSRSSTASTAHLPADAAPSQTPGLDILQPDRAVIAPLHITTPQSQPGSSLQRPTAQQSQQQSASHPTQAKLAEQGRHGAPSAATARSRHTPLPDESTTAASADESEQSQLRYDVGSDESPAAAAFDSEGSQLRYDAGPEASVSGSSWVSLEGAQGPNLPSWAAKQPSLLWLWVQPGCLPIQHETVRVCPLSSRGFGRVGPDDVGAFSSPRAACTQPSGSVDVQVNLEYLQGCHRAHAAWLTLPITPPFRIHTVARELPMRRIAIKLIINSNLPWAATLTTLTLNPQHGFRLDPPAGQGVNVFPISLAPGATASAVVFVTSKSGGRSASRSNMLRGSNAQVCSVDVQYRVDSQASPSAAVSEMVPEWGRRLLDDAAVPLPPPAGPSNRDEDRQELSSRHSFNLIMAPVEGTPRSMVYIRLLGPFSARLGEPVTLCWQLDRRRPDAASQEVNTLQYDVHAAAEGWRPLGVRAGCVGLSAEKATATVEASWVPITAGSLPAPELHLRDESHQETFDVGANAEFINVVPL